MAWAPHITVATVVRHPDQADRFLLVEESATGRDAASQDALVFNQPAGHIEAHETLLDGAIRETLEETGWHVQPTALLGLYTYTPPSDPDCTYYRVCFLADPIAHDAARPLDTGIAQAVWLTHDELIRTNRARSPLVAQCIADALNGRAFPLEVINERFLASALPTDSPVTVSQVAV